MQNDQMTNACPVCRTPLVQPAAQDGEVTTYLCPNCGPFRASGSAVAVLARQDFSRADRAKLAFGLRRNAGNTLLTSVSLESLISNTTLPDALGLIDNLVLYLVSELEAPGEVIDLHATNLRALVGALTSSGTQWVLDQALEIGLISGRRFAPLGGSDDFHIHQATLTSRGWQRADELLRAAKDSRKAFMAMKFGDSELDAVFRASFKPAIAQTGFDLVRLDEAPRAGLIDDRLRVEIRTSKFLIADLTHGNNGAYWEAGFAEGLGRPVIYTCRKDVFEDHLRRPHFDTNHHLTVVWDPADLQSACEHLKATVRVTLPADARASD